MKIAYLLDTDWVIDYFNDKEPVASKIEELKEAGISVISLAELYEGVLLSRDPKTSEKMLLDFLSGIAIVGVDEGICKIFGKLRGKLRKEGLLIGDFDLLIASTAIYYEIPLGTNNLRHYERIEELKTITA